MQAFFFIASIKSAKLPIDKLRLKSYESECLSSKKPTLGPDTLIKDARSVYRGIGLIVRAVTHL